MKNGSVPRERIGDRRATVRPGDSVKVEEHGDDQAAVDGEGRTHPTNRVECLIVDRQ